MSVRILEGDALQVLQTLPDCSVQMCCTSPPYFGLRDYGVSGQLGLEKTPDLYVEAMVGVFREVKRVLRDDGTLWLNIGDSYAGSFGAQSRGKPGAAPLSAKQGSGRAPEVWGTGRPVTAKVDGCKPKDLIGIPWLLAFALRADGWYLRSDIIWHKLNPMPESITDRPTKSHEYLFLFAKSERYFYDADAVREDAQIRDDARPFGNAGNNRHGDEGRLYVPPKQRKPAGWDTGAGGHGSFHRNGRAEEIEYTDVERGGRNRRSVWSIATQPYSEAHFATFPPKLIEPCILAGSAKQACENCGAPWERITERPGQPAPTFSPLAITESGALPDGGVGTHRNMGGRYQAWLDANPKQTTGFKPTCDCENSGTGKSLVLDPFGGAGTTGLVADRLGRDALLIELNPKYAEMARRRIHSDNPLFGDVA